MPHIRPLSLYFISRSGIGPVNTHARYARPPAIPPPSFIYRIGPILCALLAAVLTLALFPTPARPDTLIEYYPDGSVHYEYNVNADFELHGLSREYYPSGVLKAERNYENGRLEGISRLYYNTGELMTEWVYRDGKRHGLTIGYYKSGRLKDKGVYKNDLLDGLILMFYPDGTRKAELHFKDNRQEGISRTYRPDGTLEFIYHYRKGRLLKRERYDATGQPAGVQEYPAPPSLPRPGPK